MVIFCKLASLPYAAVPLAYFDSSSLISVVGASFFAHSCALSPVRFPNFSARRFALFGMKMSAYRGLNYCFFDVLFAFVVFCSFLEGVVFVFLIAAFA